MSRTKTSILLTLTLLLLSACATATPTPAEPVLVGGILATIDLSGEQNRATFTWSGFSLVR